ncbi:MAG TPA: hypothetical protein VEJ18_13700 [Planctomycetota bacterium]|nr:hypothetical protein [Planctomycetota bacterium]
MDERHQREQREKLEAMEREKGEKIAQYMSLQDQADKLNEDIYRVCCDVETLNARIDALKAEMRRDALKAQAPAKKTP